MDDVTPVNSFELTSNHGTSNHQCGTDNHGYHHDELHVNNGKNDTIKSTEQLQKTMGFRQGFALMIGLILGSGIFISPQLVAKDTSSSGMMIIIWLVAGILGMMGSLCYCELGGICKVAGGNYQNILKVYGRVPAFLCAWTTCLVIDPSCLSAISLTIGLYLAKPFYVNDIEAESTAKIIAFVVIIIALLLNCTSSRIFNRIQSCLAVMQISAVAFVIGVGIYEFSIHKSENFHAMFNGTILTSHDIPHVGIALFGALWSYDGWSSMNNVVEEMKNPGRDLLLTVLTAFPLVILSYILVNLSLLTLMTRTKISASKDVAVDFISIALGQKSSYLMMVLVALSAYGTLNGTLFACSRLTLAAAREGHMPGFFSFINTKSKTPIPGTILASTIAILMLIPKISDLNSLILLFSQAQWFIYGSSVVGVIILRFRSPNADRPFKVFIGFPILMSIVALTLVIIPFFKSLLLSVALFGFILAGIPIYVIFVHYHDRLPHGYKSAMEYTCTILQRYFGMVRCEVNES